MNIHVFFGNATFHAKSMIANLKIIDENAIFYIVCRSEKEFNTVIGEEILSAKPIRLHRFSFELIRFYYKKINVFFHGLDLSLFTFNYFLTCIFPQKVVSWICWGSGLNEHGGFKGLVYTFYKKRIYSSFAKINSLMSPDMESLKKIGVSCDVKLSVIPYIDDYFAVEKLDANPFYDNKFDHIINFFKKVGYFILIGNQSSKHHNHKDFINALSSLDGMDLYPVLLMSYPDSNSSYVSEVETLLEEKFTGKYIILKELLPRLVYDYVLSKVNAIIIDTEHQTGLAAIYSGISNSAIIVLRENSKNSRWLKFLNIEHLYSNQVNKDFIKNINSVSGEILNQNFIQLNSAIGREALTDKWRFFLNVKDM